MPGKLRASLVTILMWFGIALPHTAPAAESFAVDVMVYGATPGGIAAAIAAGKTGRTVMLVEPTSRIGGMTTSGLSHTDFHSFESLTGAFLDFSQRVEAYYATHFGPDSRQVSDSFRGTFGEPSVNLQVFQAMLAEHRSITVKTGLTLSAVSTKLFGQSQRITDVTVENEAGDALRITARVFIDGTYEGDLMAAAGVPWRVGREGRAEYGESLAPEQSDGQLQAYNFRFIMTRDPNNRVMPEPPAGYRREDFLGVLPALESPRIRHVFDYPKECIFKAQTPPLPNGKYDINDVSNGLIRLSLPGVNLPWPDGNATARKQVFAEHLRDQVGLLYFLQNDEAVPAEFREEARQWGWCRDEFVETSHLPPQLYVREARRMLGQRVYTQRDSEHAEGDARAKLHVDAIAMADYGNNCHGTKHEGPRFGGRHTGEFYNPVPPYQIPYGVLTPRRKDMENLLVPVAASSSHVGFCALRLEPIWMSLGQAAGHAAAMAVDADIAVQAVSLPELQSRLHHDRSATIYVSDVAPSSPDFVAVQWWGTLGGLHGLHPMPKKPGQRGERLHGQYYEASPGHAVELDRTLEPSTAQRWRALARQFGLGLDGLPDADGKATRGDFIRAAAQRGAADRSEK